MQRPLVHAPLLLVLWLLPATAADFSAPRGRVEDAVGRVVDILRESGLDRDARWARIAVVIRDSFDFRTMSQSVLATQWKQATAEERDLFTRFFSQYIEQVYRDRIEAYAGQEIVYGRESVEGDRASVAIEIFTATTSIPVSFRLRSVNGNWVAVDVVIEGISLVDNYRETFAAISRNEGMDSIMIDVRQRMARHRDRAGSSTGVSAPQ